MAQRGDNPFTILGRKPLIEARQERIDAWRKQQEEDAAAAIKEAQARQEAYTRELAAKKELEELVRRMGHNPLRSGPFDSEAVEQTDPVHCGGLSGPVTSERDLEKYHRANFQDV
jgi:muconolactone delta-isomerase